MNVGARFSDPMVRSSRPLPQPPPLGMGHRLPHISTWPHADVPRTIQRLDKRWTVMTRQQRRREAIARATATLTARYGGEKRRALRAMGRALGKRSLCEHIKGAAA